MKFSLLTISLVALCFSTLQISAQTKDEPDGLGLPGDNLNLFAVLDLFQKSRTIEDFEKSLNDEKTAINNLDLNLDNKVDFIKVETTQNDDDFTFILQVPVNEKETQDVAVIFVSKDENKEIYMQIVGDPDLYGKDYIIEPQAKEASGATPNPGYTGDDPATIDLPSLTPVVKVESTPIVQYVYSPVYVPYHPPYYWGYYPPYYNPFIIPISFNIYWSNHYHYHGYGYGHTTVIHHSHHYNNYYGNRNYSNTVVRNNTNGNYRGTTGSPRVPTGGSASTRPSTGATATPRPSTGTGTTKPTTKPSPGTSPSTRPTTKPSPGTSPSTRPSPSPTTRPSTTPSTRPSPGTSPSTRPAPSPTTRPSPSTYGSTPMGASRNMQSSSASRSSGASRSSYSGASRSGYSGGGGRRR